jgi:hypothetical protein
MISVIMPTMFVPENTVNLIKKVTSHPLVSELILIDNTENDVIHITEEIPKLVYIKEGKNTFVNPAWNKGASLSKEDKLMFLNDDIDTDFQIIDLIYEHITEGKGIIGLGEGCWRNKRGEFRLSPINEIVGGFACMFFIHKNSYREIPSELKVWYGDNFLIHKTGKQAWQIMNWQMGGDISRTVLKPEFRPVINEDGHHWSTISRTYK